MSDQKDYTPKSEFGWLKDIDYAAIEKRFVDHYAGTQDPQGNVRVPSGNDDANPGRGPDGSDESGDVLPGLQVGFCPRIIGGAVAKFLKDQGTLKAPTKKVVSMKDAPTAYVLPTQKTTPVANLLGYVTLIFGEKKIGKTSMLSEGDVDTFFAFFEPGGKSLSTYSDVFTSWATFKLFCNEAVRSKRFPHVVIDTVDIAYDVASKYALKKLGIEHAGDAGYGKGWAAVRDEFAAPIMKLVNGGVAVTFISHADDKEIETRDGTKFTKLMPTMPKQARNLVEGLVDIWAYYGYNGRDRELTILGDDHISAGHRLVKHFRYPDGKPIRAISMGHTAKEAMKNFTDAFHNRYIDPGPKKPADAVVKLPKKVFRKTLS